MNNGLNNWVLNMLKTHCSEQFQATMGMSVDDMQAALKRGDKAALERVRLHGERLHKESPHVCQQAAAWAKTAFSAPGGAVNTQQTQTNNPIERTQNYELQ